MRRVVWHAFFLDRIILFVYTANMFVATLLITRKFLKGAWHVTAVAEGAAY